MRAMACFALLVGAGFLGVPQLGLSESFPTYDLKTFTNPLRQIPSSCEACANIYYVTRPLFPLINHEFVGVEIESSCQQSSPVRHEVYGLTKGSDLDYFTEQLGGGSAKNLFHMATVCDQEAIHVLDVATAVSNDWQDLYGSLITLLPRVVATPVMGRPCAKSAQEVKQEIEYELLER